MEWLQSVFGSTDNVSWQQECMRAVLIFAYGLLVVRIAGRRVFGRWSALDIVISIIVGSNLSRALTGTAPLFGTLAATSLLMLLHWVLAQLAARSAAVSRIVEGKPIELGRDGAIESPVLRRLAVSQADLEEALRQSGIERVEDSRILMLEPSGKISVIK